ncbi:MAG: hypothetical protein ACLFR1_02180 [Spirochaetia bacterium]
MKKILVIILFTFICLSFAFGADFSSTAWNVTEAGTQGGAQLYSAENSSGQTFRIASYITITDQMAQNIASAAQRFYNWQYLEIDSMSFVVSEQNIELNIVPESFVYNSADLSEYMPSGMLFYIGNEILYNFRMLANNLFVRMRGQLYNETQLCEKILRAVNNPVAFIQTYDPEYIQTNFSAVYDEITALEQTALALAEETESGDAVLAESVAELFAQIAELSESLSTLNSSLSDLTEQFQTLRLSVLSFENRGFFGGINQVDPNVVAQIVQIKQDNPEFTISDVQARLSEQEVSVSVNVIRNVFGAYFNEFE